MFLDVFVSGRCFSFFNLGEQLPGSYQSATRGPCTSVPWPRLGQDLDKTWTCMSWLSHNHHGSNESNLFRFVGIVLTCCWHLPFANLLTLTCPNHFRSDVFDFCRGTRLHRVSRHHDLGGEICQAFSDQRITLNNWITLDHWIAKSANFPIFSPSYPHVSLMFKILI